MKRNERNEEGKPNIRIHTRRADIQTRARAFCVSRRELLHAFGHVYNETEAVNVMWSWRPPSEETRKDDPARPPFTQLPGVSKSPNAANRSRASEAGHGRRRNPEFKEPAWGSRQSVASSLLGCPLLRSGSRRLGMYASVRVRH